ncbi:MAG: hypothetical protein E3J66_06510 [Dehalococcoidia bacterium]|nr:MAG: hypothetical protein E3J66_06510 [Dehalococcoidia bacterium]
MPGRKEGEREKPYQNWVILYPTQKGDLKILEGFLLPKQELSLGATSVLNYLLKPPKDIKLPLCRSVLVEDAYFDQDFSDSVSTFYSRGFRDINKICRRLHFFSRRIKPSDVTEFGALEQLNDSYLGFSVIRPLQVGKLGRTVIKARRENPEVEFPTCCGRLHTNIAGEELFVDSAPFMEQDGRVQTCSSVAIWISTTVMAHSFNFPKYTTSEIMNKATQTLVGARAGPTQGLTYEQMMLACRDMGYAPIIFDETDKLEAIYQIYSYVESGIPPILLLQLPDGNHHAVTVIGHAYSLLPQPRLQRVCLQRLGEEILCYVRSSEWVPYFYIHDDQRGIFRELYFLDPDPDQLRQKIVSAHADTLLPAKITVDLKEWHCPVSINLGLPSKYVPKETIANLWGTIVPLPKEIALSHSEMEMKCAWLISFCFSRLKLKLPQSLVLRSYLTRSNDYKVRIGQNSEMSAFVRMLYRGKSMPKWLWMIEMSTADLVNVASVNDLRIRGELILDATGNPWPTDFVAFHWVDDKNEGAVATMTREDSDIDAALMASSRGPDKPYRPMVR